VSLNNKTTKKKGKEN